MNSTATLIRYAELSIKGQNRPTYERALMRNVLHVLEGHPPVTAERMRGRLLVHHPKAPPAISERLCKVCGIKNLSPVFPVETKIEAIVELAEQLFRRAVLQRSAAPSFRVRTRRADKGFPLRSLEVDQRVGGHLKQRFPECPVRMDDAEVEVGIEIRPEGSFLFLERLPGPGGLPVGTSGRAIALISGGIDSPVAAYLAMKRGLHLGFCFFHSAEFTGEGPLSKVERLVKVLAAFQSKTVLHVVPFGHCQLAIRAHCREEYRTLLYRRMMHRIAERIALQVFAPALVAGDSLAQVASQTLENLFITQQATSLLLLRPLLTFDKEETIELARRLGTFELSILDEPDCCTLFQPRRPRIHGKLGEVQSNEARLPVQEVVEAALEGMRTLDFK